MRCPPPPGKRSATSSAAIDAYITPTGDDRQEAKRLAGLASLNEQLVRDLRRRTGIQRELTAIESTAPDRRTILSAIQRLDLLWDQLTNQERSSLITRVIERIDHDPSDSTIAITLSPAGLKSFEGEVQSDTNSIPESAES